MGKDQASTELQHYTAQWFQVPEQESLTEEELIQAIEKQVSYLLEKDMASLLNIAYRIDIDEQKFKFALSTLRPSREIAVLFVKRMVEKVYWRTKYSTKS